MVNGVFFALEREFAAIYVSFFKTQSSTTLSGGKLD